MRSRKAVLSHGEVKLFKLIKLKSERLKKSLKEVHNLQKFLLKGEPVTEKEFHQVIKACEALHKACRDQVGATGQLLDISQRRLLEATGLSSEFQDDSELQKVLEEAREQLLLCRNRFSVRPLTQWLNSRHVNITSERNFLSKISIGSKLALWTKFRCQDC